MRRKRNETDTETPSQPKFGWINLVKLIWRFIEPGQRKALIIWVIVLSIVPLVTLVQPYVLGTVINYLTQWKQGQPKWPVFAFCAVSAALLFIASQLRLRAKWHLAKMRIGMAKRIRIEGFTRLTQFPMDWQAQVDVGNRMQQIQSGTKALGDMYRSITSEYFRTFIPMIASVVVFAFVDWRLFGAAFLYIGLALLNEKYFFGKCKEASDKKNKATEKSAGRSHEAATNILTLKAHGAEDAIIEQVAAREGRIEEATMLELTLNNTKWQFFQGLNAMMQGGFLANLSVLFFLGGIEVGMMVTYSSYLGRLIDGASDGSDIVSNTIEHLSAVGRMIPILEDPIPEETGTLDFPNWSEIRVVNGRLTYAGQTWAAMQNLNLVIRRGEWLGIAGSSGSGKSTLAKAIILIHPLTEGVIEIDGIPLEDIRREERSKHIAVVLQKTQLFNASLRDNITLYRDVDEKLLEKAIKIAQLQDLIDKYPDEGLDVMLGPQGNHKASGGEEQRIGIARAICRGTEILIFDEATSSLDVETEKIIQEALVKELTGKTIITIAHRLPTLASVDRLVVFDYGTIIEEGTFAELSQKPNGRFAQLCAIQREEIIPA